MTSRRKMFICLLSLLLSAYAPLSTTFSLPRPMPTSRKQLRSKPSFREFVVFRGIPESEFPHEGADGNNNEDNDTNQRQARPLVRLIHDLFYAMTAPFPDLRKLSRKRDDDSKFVISLRLQDGFYALLAYFGVGVFAYHRVFEKWSIVDALYFTCVCFSTVGYGDLSPKTRGGQIFTCAFGLAGIALLGAAVATIGSRLVQAEIEAAQIARKETRKRLMQVYDKMPKVLTNLRRASNKEQKKAMLEAKQHLAAIPRPHIPSRLVTLWKEFQSALQALSVIAFGGLLIGRLEGWPWFTSIYYSVITASTIGLGDFCPSTRAGRLAAVFVIPMSVAAAGEILASVGLALVERRQKRIFQNQLDKGLTMEHLKTMDANQDGKVEREEYILFMLKEMGLVNKNEIEELQEQFSRLDVTKSGYLDHEDLLLMAQLRGAGLIE